MLLDIGPRAQTSNIRCKWSYSSVSLVFPLHCFINIMVNANGLHYRPHADTFSFFIVSCV